MIGAGTKGTAPALLLGCLHILLTDSPSVSYRGCCRSDSKGTPKLLVRERSWGVSRGREQSARCTCLPTLRVSCLASVYGKRCSKWDRGVQGTHRRESWYGQHKQ